MARHGGTIPGKNRAFTTLVDPGSPPSTPPPKKRRRMVEAPGTAPGSETLIPRGVYRHSRFPDTTNIGAPWAFWKAPNGRESVPRFPHGRLRPAPIESAANEGQRTMPLSTDQQAEIDQARGGAQPSLRPSSPALEEI